MALGATRAHRPSIFICSRFWNNRSRGFSFRGGFGRASPGPSPSTGASGYSVSSSHVRLRYPRTTHGRLCPRDAHE